MCNVVLATLDMTPIMPIIKSKLLFWHFITSVFFVSRVRSVYAPCAGKARPRRCRPARRAPRCVFGRRINPAAFAMRLPGVWRCVTGLAAPSQLLAWRMVEVAVRMRRRATPGGA